jgi:hypothetical protein
MDSLDGSHVFVYTPSIDFVCLLERANPLRVEDEPPGVPVAEKTRCWLDMNTAMACFLRSMCCALSPTISFSCLFHP